MCRQRLFFILTIISLNVFAQNQGRYTINGFVKDFETGEKLINAYVFDQVSKKAVTTNSYGFYSITLGRDTAAIEVQYIGYMPSVRGVSLNRSTATELDMELTASKNILDEVTVVGISDIDSTNVPALSFFGSVYAR